MIIILTGTNGAGKGTLLGFFVNRGFKHYSMSGFSIEEVKRQNLDVNRDNTRLVANDLRKNFGPAYISEELYKKALIDGGNVVIEAVRSPGELDPFIDKSDIF